MRPRREDSSAYPWKCLTLPGNMFKCDKDQLRQSPGKPQPSTAGWEFPYTSCAGRSSPREWGQRKLSCPVCPWWRLSKDSPVVLVLCEHCHAPDGVSATRFKLFPIHTPYKPREHPVLCGCFIQCSYWHDGPTLPALTGGEGHFSRVQSAVIRETNLVKTRQRWHNGVV